MTSRARLLSAALFVCCIGPSSARVSAQINPTTIREDPACAGCSVHVERILRFGGTDLPFSISPLARIAQSTRGDYFVGSLMEIGPVARFSTSGDFRELIGRRGSGPGEFQLISGIQRGPADSIIILESSRLTIMGHDGGPGRVLRLPGRMSQIWPLENGRFFGVGLVPRGQVFLPALHVLAPDGALLQSFGPPAAGGGEYLPVAAPAANGSFWVVTKTADGYRLENWQPSGKRQQIAARKIDWTALERIPTPRGRRLPAEWKPSAAVQAIGTDDEGRILVSLVVPSSTYWEVTPPRGRTSDLDAQYDAIIEVIDPGATRVLASTRVNTYVLHFLENASAVSRTVEPSTGDIVLDVSRVSLQTPTRR